MEEVLLNPDTVITLATQLKKEREEKAKILSQKFEIEQTLEESKPKIEWAEKNQNSEGYHTTTSCVHDLNICPDFMNRVLCQYKIQRKTGGEYSLTAAYQDKGFAKMFPVTYGENGEKSKLQLKWSEKGRRMIHQLIKHAEMDGFIVINKKGRYSLGKEYGYTKFEFKN